MLNGRQFKDEPVEPGSVPVPEHHVRLFHASGNIRREEGDTRPWAELVHERAESLRKHGIDVSHARGESYGEPSVVWASAGKPISDYEESIVAEFHAPVSKLDIGSYYGQGGSEAEHIQHLNDARSHVTLHGSVPPEDIIAVHEPWHAHYRYMTGENPEYLEDVVKGRFDNLEEDEPMTYGPAIKRIKRLAHAVNTVTRLPSP